MSKTKLPGVDEFTSHRIRADKGRDRSWRKYLRGIVTFGLIGYRYGEAYQRPT